ncbi:MAG: DUF58 domain-containing protein [Actinobacteria bacterium]|jgi:uncharacterized protein (DUF58 family)|nr:MAG: DUF58 domain-containing protein [Actinomycetota bacterium]
MLTRQGMLVAIGSGALIVAGRLLGVLELFLLGVTGAALVVIALAVVWLRRIRLEVLREVVPARVHAGTPSRVDLSVNNIGLSRSPVMRAVDPVSGTRGANLLIGPLAPNTAARASYRLPTERRGVLAIGPLTLELSDPFGLARATLPGANVTNLTVYPPIHRLTSLPPTGGADPHSGLEHRRTLNRGGSDFYALRQFVVGDELRRVHWPSTARHDELMVRQDELPWQGRLAVVVDNTQGRLPEEGLDLAVSIAASVVVAAHQKGNLVRVVTGDGSDSSYLSGNAQVESLLEMLAVLEPHRRAALNTALDRAAMQQRTGGVVVITGELDSSRVSAVRRLSRSFSWVTSVVIDKTAWDPTADVEGLPMASRRAVRVSKNAPFPLVWNAAMASGIGDVA